jgi:hypothetical protein
MRSYLLTCENILDLDITHIINRLQGLLQRVTLRITIQEHHGKMDKPGKYEGAFKALAEHADLMIEFVDSDAAKHLTPDDYRGHVNECLGALGRYCKVGEAGNEINGDNWKHGRHPHDPREVVQMVQDTIAACTGAGLKTAVTYYLSTDEKPPMSEWIKQYALSLRSDYALVSYYPNSARSSFTPEQIHGIFSEFADAVSAPVIGWGEYGTEGKYHNVPKDGRNLVRQVEQEYWKSLSGIRGYGGFGGYWDWGTQDYMDEILRDVWR